MTNKKFEFKLVFVLVALFIATGCSSQGNGNASTNSSDEGNSDSDFPSKPITYMIPFNSGGQSDIAARRQQQELEKILGVSVNITYKPGGGGALGWGELVNKKPTGYYITGINLPHIVLQPLLRDNAGYKTEQIKPVGIFQATPIGIAVHKDSDIDSLEDLIAKAKESPGTITVAGSGKYTGHHLAFLQLQNLADIEMQYVPFTGAAPTIKNFLGGHTIAIMANSNDLLKYNNEMKILAIGTEKTFEPLPDAPTFQELGFEMTARIDRGVAVPPGTSKEVIKKFESAFLEVVKDPKFQQKMLEEGFEPRALGVQESGEYIQKKNEQFMPILDELGLLDK